MNATIAKIIGVISSFIVKYISVNGLKIARKYIVASVLGWSGPLGWITNFALNYVIKKGWIVLETKSEVHKKKEAYDKVRNDPNSTVEDRSKAFHDLLNN